MSGTAPYVSTIRIVVASVAAAADLTSPIGFMPYAGALSGARYIPTSVLTGADTNSRTINIYNRGQAGAGNTVMATKAFANTVNAPANDSTDITLSGVGANLAVAAGDVLDWESLHIGATGLADPGGLVEIDIARS